MKMWDPLHGPHPVVNVGMIIFLTSPVTFKEEGERERDPSGLAQQKETISYKQ